ncbi:unnamed protein product [Danaus chrysippus]|uniref:(African queen) hypothetical protein n=1 Tax=Danaus chrysippus TaxID=151541 RepID=A0A8J2QKG0_9NEOP|nr:unnamed protein product [Danaus chrysippus]
MQFSVLTWCKEAMDSETTGSEGSSGVRIVTRKSLFDKMKNENLRNLEKKLCFLRDHLLTQDNLSEITTKNRQGRPRKSFGESSERSKRRKTEEIRSNVEDGVIVHAAQVELRKSENVMLPAFSKI